MSRIQELKDLIDTAGVSRSDYAKFLFFHLHGRGNQYNPFEGRSFEDCITKGLVAIDGESNNYYRLNASNKRNVKVIQLLADIQSMLESYKPELNHRDDLFDYSLLDADFWEERIGYKII